MRPINELDEDRDCGKSPFASVPACAPARSSSKSALIECEPRQRPFRAGMTPMLIARLPSRARSVHVVA